MKNQAPTATRRPLRQMNVRIEETLWRQLRVAHAHEPVIRSFEAFVAAHLRDGLKLKGSKS